MDRPPGETTRRFVRPESREDSLAEGARAGGRGGAGRARGASPRDGGGAHGGKESPSVSDARRRPERLRRGSSGAF
eukprot:20166-Pelagococcus_subviridis.AAC.1